MSDPVSGGAGQTLAAAPLFGGGDEITGRIVEYWGHQWIISGKNYCGDWDVVRFEHRSNGDTVKIESSIAPVVLPETHPHYARLLPPNDQAHLRQPDHDSRKETK